MKSISKQLEDHKATVEGLYVQEGKTAKEVLKILLEGFDFEATENQLKKKLKEWSFNNKNIRAETMVQIARSRARRGLKNKQSAFRVNKKPVPDRNIDKFMERKDLCAAAVINMASPDSALSPTFSVFTPERASTPPTEETLQYPSHYNCPILETNSPSAMDSEPPVSRSSVPDHDFSRLQVAFEDLPKSNCQEATDDEQQSSGWPNVPENQTSNSILNGQPISAEDSKHPPADNKPSTDRLGAAAALNEFSTRTLGPEIDLPIRGKSASASPEVEMKLYLEARKALIASETVQDPEPKERVEQLQPSSKSIDIPLKHFVRDTIKGVPAPWTVRRPFLHAPYDLRVWTCHSCSHAEMSDFTESCPICDHVRCEDCPKKSITGWPYVVRLNIPASYPPLEDFFL